MGAAVIGANLAIVRASATKRLWLGAAGVAVFIATIWSVRAIAVRNDTREQGFGLDFIAFYTAGTFVREGRPGELYDLPAVHQYQRALAAANHFDIGHAYGPWWNPPFYALVFEPLAALPYPRAAAVWIGVNLAAFAIACALLCRMLPAGTARRSVAVVPVLTILSTPFILAISHAQNTCTSLLLLTCVVTLWRSRRALAAGLVGGLMFYKPQVAAVIACVLVIDLGWRAFAGYAVTGIGLLLTNLLALPGTLADYLRRLPHNVHDFQTGTPYPWEQHVTLKAFWRLLLQGHSLGDASTGATILTGVSLLMLAALLVGACVRFKRTPDGSRRTDRDRLITAAVAAAPLLMPFYFDYDLLLLAMPAVLFAADCVAQGRAARRAAMDRPTIALWAFLYVWQMVNTDVGARYHVNLSVALLALLSARLASRVGRPEAEVIVAPAPVLTAPPSRAAA